MKRATRQKTRKSKRVIPTKPLSKRIPKKRDILTSDNLGNFAHKVSTTNHPIPNNQSKDLRLSRKHLELNAEKIEELAYHQDLRDLDPNMDWDEDDHLWTAKMIMEHKGGRKVKVKVMWSDMTTTWEDLNSLFLHQPILVTKYAVKQHTLLKPGWHVVRKYLEIDSTARERTRIYKLTSKRAKVYKFGIQVPQDPP